MHILCDKTKFPFIFTALEVTSEANSWKVQDVSTASGGAGIGMIVVRNSSQIKETTKLQVAKLASAGATRYCVCVMDIGEQAELSRFASFIREAIGDDTQGFEICLPENFSKIWPTLRDAC